MNTIRAYIAGGLLLALLAGFGASCWYAHHSGYAAGEAAMRVKYEALVAQYAAASAKAEAEAREQEQASATRMASIEAQHAQEMQHAKQDADAVIAGLHAGNLRLREQWRGCEAAAGVPSTSASSGQPDAAADDRAASAAAIVRAADEADATIRALQAIVKADRERP